MKFTYLLKLMEFFLPYLMRRLPFRQLWRFVSYLRISPSYEVLSFDAELELLDRKGKTAVYRKSQSVRFLRDDVVAYEDQAFGDGDIFASYQCSPGKPVDFYQDGNLWRILISLRETKSKGQIERFIIERQINGAFVDESNYLQINIEHPTTKLTMSIIFPSDHPPRRITIIQRNKKRSQLLDAQYLTQLPDQRYKATWAIPFPNLFEQYIVKWDW